MVVRAGILISPQFPILSRSKDHLGQWMVSRLGFIHPPRPDDHLPSPVETEDSFKGSERLNFGLLDHFLDPVLIFP